METFETVHKRCSLKAHLSGRAMETEKINRILEAACLAPSARNTQPWRFIVVQGKEAVEALVQTAFLGPGSVVQQAPVIIVVCARADDDVTIDGKEYYLFDTGLEVENMVLAATDLGLATHLMASFNEAEIKKLLHIPDDFRVVIVTPLAYPPEASYDEAAEEILGQRTRKSADEVIYFGKWGESA